MCLSKPQLKLKKDTQLSEIVFHLKYISDFASDSVSTFKGIKKLENTIKAQVRFALFSRIVILSESFLDEFEFFSNFQNPVINKTILNIKKICQPAIMELMQWSDNRKFRNHILAHNFRYGKNNKSVFTNKRLDKYKIPKNEIELSFICELLGFITDIVLRFYKEDYLIYKLDYCPITHLKEFKTENYKKQITYFNKILEKVKVDINKGIETYNNS